MSSSEHFTTFANRKEPRLTSSTTLCISVTWGLTQMYDKAFQTLVIDLKSKMTDSFLVDIASGMADIETDKDECMRVLKVRPF